MFDSLKDWLAMFAQSSLEGFNETVENVTTTLTAEADLWDEMLDIAEGMEPFCYTIVGICLLIELVQTASKVDMLKWEHGLKAGIKMVLAMVCIDSAPSFLEACYKQALEWMGLFAGASQGLAGLINALKNFITDVALGAIEDKIVDSIDAVTGMGNILGMFTSCLLIFTAINVCGLVIQMLAVGRMFEVYSYLVISPLPFAFLPLGMGEGLSINRITSNYIKNFIAVCLQGVMMIAAVYVYNQMFGGALIETALNNWGAAEGMETLMELAFFMLVRSILLIIFVSKSSSMAKSMISAM